MLALLAGMNLWWRIGAIAIVVVAVGGAVWYVHHQIWQSGYEDAEAVYKPKVAKLETDLKNSQDDLAKAVAANAVFVVENTRLQVAVNTQNAAVDDLRASALKAQDAARAAMAAVIREQASNTRNRAEIKRLEAIVNGPPLTEGDCVQADDILRTLVRDRVSIGAGAAAPANH